MFLMLAADAVVGQYLPHVAQGLEHASSHSHGVRKDGGQHQVRCRLAPRARTRIESPSQSLLLANCDFVESQPARRENALRA